MSRIGQKPVKVASGAKVSVSGHTIQVDGPKGSLSFSHRPEVVVSVDGDEVSVQRSNEERAARAFQGLTRALVANMVHGVTEGYERKLEIIGVGYLASVQNNVLNLRVGMANELKVPVPQGLEVTCPDQTHIVVKGCDKQAVGDFAAKVRGLRKPEPYKGKGIRYQGEQIKLKPGKSASK
ncbi:50S ribosomal protein L6 [Planctomycetaceae bacterium SH139]